MSVAPAPAEWSHAVHVVEYIAPAKFYVTPALVESTGSLGRHTSTCRCVCRLRQFRGRNTTCRCVHHPCASEVLLHLHPWTSTLRLCLQLKLHQHLSWSRSCLRQLETLHLNLSWRTLRLHQLSTQHQHQLLLTLRLCLQCTLQLHLSWSPSSLSQGTSRRRLQGTPQLHISLRTGGLRLLV